MCLSQFSGLYQQNSTMNVCARALTGPFIEWQLRGFTVMGNGNPEMSFRDDVSVVTVDTSEL